MNNNIQESYCSFKVSVLLKDKGFNVYCQSWYTEDTQYHYSQDEGQTLGWNNKHLPSHEYSRPTHALAIEWIRVNFGICITVYPHARKWCGILEDISEKGWIRENGSERMMPKYISDYDGKEENSLQEAIEAALLYTLQNLIK